MLSLFEVEPLYTQHRRFPVLSSKHVKKCAMCTKLTFYPGKLNSHQSLTNLLNQPSVVQIGASISAAVGHLA